MIKLFAGLLMGVGLGTLVSLSTPDPFKLVKYGYAYGCLIETGGIAGAYCMARAEGFAKAIQDFGYKNMIEDTDKALQEALDQDSQETEQDTNK